MYEHKLPRDKNSILIIDTDIGPDCDDVGALALSFYLRKKYGYTVGAVINCTSNPHGCGCVAAIAKYCGEELPVLGTYEKEGFLTSGNKYNEYIDENMAGEYTVLPAQNAYYNILSAAEDKSVTVITIGQFDTLAAAIREYGELFGKKVRSIISMAGAFPDGEREYNVICDTASAKYAIENSPVPMIFSGFEVGESIFTGYDAPPVDAEVNPLYTAYKLYCKSEAPRRNSWDLTAVQYAIEGENGFYRLSESGRVSVDEESGKTIFTPDADADRYYLIKTAPDEEIAKYLDNIAF